MVTAKQTLLFPDYNHDVLLSNVEYLKSLSHLAKRAAWLSINATFWNYHQSLLNPPKYFVTMITLRQVGERWRRLQPRKSECKSRKFFNYKVILARTSSERQQQGAHGGGGGRHRCRLHSRGASSPSSRCQIYSNSSWTQCHFDLIGKPFHLRDHFRGYFEIANGHSVD